MPQLSLSLSLPKAWKSRSKYELVREIYKNAQAGLFERESQGLNFDDSTTVFPTPLVRAMMERRTKPSLETQIVIGFDPSGGGGSAMSLCSCSMHRNEITILGWEEQPVTSVQDVEACLLGHIRALRRVYKTNLLVMAFESNLGMESAHAAACLERENVPSVYVIKEKNRTGVYTTLARKEMYSDTLRFYLEQNCIGLADHGVISRKGAKESQRVQRVVREQVCSYRRLDIPAKAGTLAKRQFTGKLSGQNDDACIALQLSVYWLTRWASRSIPGCPSLEALGIQ